MDCSQYFVMFVISQRPLPKCANSQAATSQDCTNRSARLTIAVCGASEGLNPNLWEVAAWYIEHLGSCHLGHCHLESRPWENAFGKVPNTVLVTDY